MSAKWSDKDEKLTALVSDDEFMILDSQDPSVSTKNKRVKLSNVQANVVTDIDVNGFSLSDAVLITPNIDDFTSATHDHSDTADGGQLTNSALSTGVFSAITGLGDQTQPLEMGTTNQIKNVEDPTDPQDAATKNYVDTGTAIWTKTDTNIFPTTLTDRVGLGLSVPEATLHVRSLAVTGDITVDGDSDDLFIENQGNVGYTSPPTITIGDPPDTVTATGTAVLATGVKRVDITNGGTGYTSVVVTFTGGGGTGAAGTAVLDGTTVDSVTITNRGTGYTTEPGVVFTGDGENAAGDSVLTDFVTSITITNSGSGYADIPTITIAPAGGGGGDPVDAEATAVLVNTEVTTINIDVEGQDYDETPAVTFTLAPTKETATAVVDEILDEKVVSVQVTNGGMGYKVPPSVVTFDGGGGNGVGVDTVTVANSSIQSITVTQGGAGLTIVSEPDQVGVVAFTTGGTTTTTEKILFDHSTERMRFIIDSVQGLIIDNLGHVAISQDNVTHAQVFTVDTDVLNVPVRILIRDDTDRLMLGYNGSDNFVTDAIQAQVIVQTDSPDLSIASCGAEASNLRFYTSDVSGLEERMRITNEGNVGIFNTDPARALQVGSITSPSTGIIRYSHNTGSNFRNWDVGTGEIATFGANDNFGIIDVTDPAAVFVIAAGTGRVGIGTISPSVKLHVIGTDGVKFEGGALDMTTQQITDVVNPTAEQDAATKNYVDNVSGIGVQAQDLDMGTNQIKNVVNPSADQDAATKNYVDGIALGLSWREPVILATTTSDGNIVLGTGGLLTIDSVVTGTDDRVLVKNQTDPVENGIYIAAVGAWVRSSDMADASDAEGAAMFVSEGTVNEGDSFVQNQVPATVGTNGLIFVQITGLNPISLDDLTDVTIAGDTTDDLLVSDSNGAWVNRQGIFTGITGLGTQTVDLDMDSFQINNVAEPTSAQDAATKNYVDTNFVTISGTETITGAKTFTEDISLVKDSDGRGIFLNTVYNNNGANGPVFNGRKANGTEIAPLVISSGSNLTSVGAFGYDGSDFELGAVFEFAAAGAWSETSHPTQFIIATTDVDSTNVTTQLSISSDGTASFNDNSIIDIALILLNDDDDSNTYTILGGALSGDFDVTIPAITANDTFALLNVVQEFTNKTLDDATNTITGVFDITGLGIQTEQLVMGQNSIGNCGVIQFTTGAEETALQFGSNNIGFDSSDQFIFAYSAVTFYSFSETEANFLSHNLLMGGAYFELTEIATPGTPVASDGRLYVKDDGTNSALFFKSDSGVEFNLLVPTVALDELTDVTITTEATNDLLEFNGSLWVNKSGVFSGITGLGLQSQNLAMNSNSIVSLGVIQFNAGEDKLQFTGAIGIDVVSDVVRFTSNTGLNVNYGFGIGEADFHDNNIINVGLVQFDDADTTLVQSSSNLQYDVATTGIHQFRINDVSELEIADTTINAPTATFQENGTNISPIGRQSHYATADTMYVPTATGANEIVVEIGAANFVSYAALGFADAGNNFGFYSWSPPTEWDPTVPITVQFYWTSANGTIGNDVIWNIQVNSYSDDEPLDVAFPTAVAITDALGSATSDLMISAESAALTLGGTTAAKGDKLIFRIARDGNAGGDTLAGLARLLGMKIFYTTDAANSA